MKKWIVVGISIQLFLIGFLALAVDIRSARARTIVVPDDYPTIQAGVNAAYEGDTVRVRSGTYSENIVIDKRVVLVGDGWKTTIVHANEFNQSVFSILGSYVSISGFTIRDAGGYLGGMPANGVLVIGMGANVTDNYIENNYHGIFLFNSGSSKITRNIIRNNKVLGIYISNSSKNTISFNNCSGNFAGIDIGFSSENIISTNDLSNNIKGIEIGSGYSYPSTFNNIIYGNNLFMNSYCGISMQPGCSGTVIAANTISKNGYQIEMYYTTLTSVYHNNFITSNSLPPIVTLGSWHVSISPGMVFSAITWSCSYPSGGNCWSDYTGIDAKSGPNQDLPGSDGIGDTPYTIDENNTDWYPLMRTYVLDFEEIVQPQESIGRSIEAGEEINFTISVKTSEDLDSEFYLNISDIPPESGYILERNPINKNSSTNLSIRTTQATPAQNYTFTVTASYRVPETNEEVVGTCKVDLTVTSPSFPLGSQLWFLATVTILPVASLFLSTVFLQRRKEGVFGRLQRIVRQYVGGRLTDQAFERKVKELKAKTGPEMREQFAEYLHALMAIERGWRAKEELKP